MRRLGLVGITMLAVFVSVSVGQESKGAPPAGETNAGKDYSGMYAFRQEGEFVQVTVEDDGRVTGFISRYAAGEKRTFVDQFFKSAKLEGNKLSFTTQVVEGVSFEFKGSVERGDGKAPGDEGYFVMKGALVENVTDAKKKVTSTSEDVAFRSFPR